MKINIEETILFLKRRDIVISELIIKDTTFTTKQLKVLHDLLQDINDKSGEVELLYKYKISRRRGLIVILEEEFYNKREYGKIDLQPYEKKSKIRFSVSNSNKIDLDTPSKIHPKNPCLYYENRECSKLKRQYKDALNGILETPFQFFEKKEAIESLSKTYEDLELC